MSPVPALEAVRRYPYGEDVDVERSRKRRRLNSPQSSAALDSGYNSASDEDHVKGSSASTCSRQEPASPQDTDSAPLGELRPRMNSEPCSSTRTPPVLFRQFASRRQPHDRQCFDRRWSEPESARNSLRSDRDADLEIIAARHQIAVARQRLYGRNGVLPNKPTAKKDLGCVGPKIHKATDVFGIFVEGCRVMDHERNLLSSLFNPPDAMATISPLDPLTPSVEETEVEQVVHFPGLVMPADTGNDDQDFETFENVADVGNNEIECFFNLDEASTPSDGECNI
ncbi:hypothetical protein DV736_g3439, partial [Chaetothyriales sp. CBS 134916]